MFVVGAGLAVDADEEGLVAERFDIFEVVLGDIPGNLLNSIFTFQEIFEIHRPFEDLVQFIDVRHAFGFTISALSFS